jgi:hypothetical protein
VSRLTKQEAASLLAKEFLGPEAKPFSQRAMTKWMRTARLPHFKVGRAVVFDREQLLEWARAKWGRNQPGKFRIAA